MVSSTPQRLAGALLLVFLALLAPVRAQTPVTVATNIVTTPSQPLVIRPKNNPSVFAYSGNISGAGSLTFAAAFGQWYWPVGGFTYAGSRASMTLTLSGNNTYSGGTLIEAGVIKFSSAANFGTGSIRFLENDNADVGLAWAPGNTADISGQLILGEYIHGIANTPSPVTQFTTLDLGGNNVVFGTPLHSSSLSATGLGIAVVGPGSLTLAPGSTATPIGLLIMEGSTVTISADSALGAAPGATTPVFGGWGIGAVTVAGGTLHTTASFELAATRDLIMGGGGDGSLDVDPGTTLTFRGDLTRGFNKRGGGTFAIGGRYSNAHVDEGTLRLLEKFYAPTILSLATLTVASGATALFDVGGANESSAAEVAGIFQISTFKAGSILGLDTTNASGAFTYGSVISRNIGFLKTGSGTLVLTGNNTYTGTTTVAQGTLSVGSDANLGAAAAPVTFAGGTLEATGTFAATRATTLDTGGGIFQVDSGKTVTWNGGIAGTAGNTFTKTGPGTLVLGGTSTYAGATTVAAGTLAAGANNALSPSSALTINGATLNIGAFNNTTGAVTLTSGSILGTGQLTSSSFALQAGTVTASLAGAGALTKTTAGTLTLSGANTYTGGSSLLAGTVNITSPATLGNGGTITFGGAALNSTGVTSASTTHAANVTAATTLNLAGDWTLGGALTGSAALTKTGNGMLTLGAAGAYSGLLTVGAGAVRYGAAPLARYDVQLASGASLIINGTNTGLNTVTATVPGAGGLIVMDPAAQFSFPSTIDANFSGGGRLDKIGPDVSSFTAPANAFTGTFYINQGTLAVSSTPTLTTGDVSLVGGATLALSSGNTAAGTIGGTGTIALGSNTLTLGRAGSGSSNFAGNINGTGGLTVAAANTLFLSLDGTNTYTGATRISGGQLQFAKTVSFYNNTPANWTDTRLIVESGATAAFNVGGTGEFASSDIGAIAALGSATGGFKSGAVLGLDTSNAAGSNFTLSAAIANPNGGTNVLGLTKLGSATLTLTGANSYTGATTIAAGTLVLGANNVLPAASAVTVATGATLDVASHDETIGGLAGAGAVALGSGNTFAVGGSGTTTFSGVMTGSGTFTKTGSGTLTLSGANPFSGTTRISGGTLVLGAVDTLASSAVALNGGTLALGGNFNPTFASLQLLADSTIDFLGRASTLTFTNVARTAGTLTIDHWSGNPLNAANEQLVFTSAPTGFTGGATLNEISFAGYGAGAKRLPSGEIVPLATSLYYTFTPTGSANWDVNVNWFGVGIGSPTFPATTGETAILGSATSSATVSLNGADRTLGYLVFDSTQNYTVAGNNLRFDVADGSAQIVNNQSGSPTISSGILLNDSLTVSQNGSGALTLSGAIANNTGTNNLVFAVNKPASGSAGTITASGAISLGTGTLTKTGVGLLTLSGTNSYSGATLIQDGTLAAASLAALGTSPITLGSATGTPTLELMSSGTFDSSHPLAVIAGGGTLVIDPGATATFTTAYTGAGDLTKLGAGTLVLGAAHVATGNLTISAGTLKFANATAPTNLTVNNGATLDFNGINYASGFNLGTSALLTNTNATAVTVSAPIRNDGSALVFSAANGDLALTGALTTTAAATVNGSGKVTLGAAPAVALTQLTVNGHASVTDASALTALTRLTVNDTAVAEFNATRAFVPLDQIVLNAHALTGDTLSLLNPVANTTVQFYPATSITLSGTGAGAKALVGGAGDLILTTPGTLSGNLGLAKVGAGNVVLSAADALGWTGAIDVRAGTLYAPYITNDVNVASGAAFYFSGGDGSALFPGTISGGGIFGLQGPGVTLTGTSSFAGTLLGALSLSGTLTASASSFTLGDRSLTLDGGTLITGAALTSNQGLNLAAGGGTLNSGAFDSSFRTLSGAGALTKTGAGKLTLTGESLIYGNLTIAAGSFQIDPGASLTVGSGTFAVGGFLQGSLTGDVINQGTLTLQPTTDVTYAGNLTGAGSLIKSGQGGLTLTGTNALTGGLTLNAGTLHVTSDTQLGSASAPLTLDQGTLQIDGTTFGTTSRPVLLTTLATINIFDAAATVTFAGVVDGGGNVIKDGAGTLVLSGVNPANNETFIFGGTLRLGNALALQHSITHVSGGSLDLGGFSATLGALDGFGGLDLGATTLTVGGGNGAATSFSGAITGVGGALVKTGDSTLVLQGANTYTGGTTVAGGTLSISSDSRLGGAAGGLTLDGGTLRNTSSSFATARAVTLGAAGGTLDVFRNAAFSGLISGSGALTADFTDTRTLTLSGANTFTGGTVLNGTGTLIVSSDSNLGDAAGTVTMGNGATLRATGSFTTNRGMLLRDTGGAFEVSSGTLAWNGVIGRGTTSAEEARLLGFTKTGSGTLQLGGVNTFDGTLGIAAGTLAVGASGSIASASQVRIDAGATFNVAAVANFALVSGQTIQGGGSIVGALTLGNGAMLRTGDPTAPLTFTSGLTFATGSILAVQSLDATASIVLSGGTLTGPAGSGGITLNLDPSIAVVAGTYPLFNFSSGVSTVTDFNFTDFALGTAPSGFDYTLSISGQTLLLTAASAIPEPSTYAAIFGGSVLGLALLRRRRRL